jgi:hypothetical protein
MRHWNEVRKYLDREIIQGMKDKKKGLAWLKELPRNQFGELLGICMAIDVVSGAVLRDTFSSILDYLKPPFINAKSAYYNAQLKHPTTEDFVCASRFNSPLLPSTDSYVRVMEIESFTTYYGGPALGLSSLDPSDVARVRKRFFRRTTNLHQIDRWYSGVNGRVWVMSKNEFSSICRGIPTDAHASILNNRLGLGFKRGGGPNGEPEMVAIEYPNNFSVGCKQPTMLDHAWNGNLNWYVSDQDRDGWGTTQSCCGTQKGIRERVHSKFKNLTSDFLTIYIGLANPPPMNNIELIAEAYKRFHALVP